MEDNIALALELQNKKRDKRRIAEILKSVDLEEFADRKPNTLSGGAQEITGVNEIIYGLRYLSPGLWLGFTVFTILLMFNFISASITAKKKEIGILRAIGARSVDVFKIFLSESGIVTVVCLVLSVIICAVLCPVVSGAIISGTAINVSVLVFMPVTLLFMLLVAVFTAVISTIIPVIIYSQKPPVDSIRAL